jgi:F-type H+-transporting ATPase subunit d
MVENFQKKYEGLQVPYPKDSVTAQIEKQAVESKAAYDKLVAESKTR